MEPLRTYLIKWNTTTDSLTKLQGAYAVLAVALLLAAGLVSLINVNLGQSILFLAMVSGLTFIGNGVVWALIKTFVVPHAQKPAPKTTRKKVL